MKYRLDAKGRANQLGNFQDLKVIALDTSIIGTAHGYLETASLNFLRSALNSAKEKPVIVATHHPPVMTGIEKMDIQNLRDSDELKEILSTYKGELKLICGHIHRNIVTQFGNGFSRSHNRFKRRFS